MANDPASIVNMRRLSQAREELGAGFVRVLSYFREDGGKSVDAIEEAMRAGSAAALVLPAHTLKGQSLHFGADALTELAEQIEVVARHCVEMHEKPTELLGEVVKLRPLFEATLAIFDRETNPIAERRPVFGRKAVGAQGAGA